MNLFSNYTLALRKAFEIIWSRASIWFVLALVSTILIAIFPIGISILTKYLIDGIVYQKSIELNLIIVASSVLLIVQMIFIRLKAYSEEYVRIEVEQFTKLSLVNHVAHLDLEYLETPDDLDRLKRVREQSSSRPYFVISAFLGVSQAIFTTVSYTFVINTYSVTISLLIFAATIIGVAISRRAGETVFTSYFSASNVLRRASYYEDIMMGRDYLYDMRIYNRRNAVMERYSAFLAQGYRSIKSGSLRKNTIMLIPDTLLTFPQLVAFYVFAQMAIDKSISVGDLTLAIASSLGLRQAAIQLLSYMGQLFEHTRFYEDYLGILSKRSSIESKISETDELDVHSLSMDNVSFRYPGAGQFALTGVSFKIFGGEKVAIVGHNGSGKTTLTKLLLRLYEPSTGQIYLNGLNINSLQVNSYRRLFSVLPQDFPRYEDSLYVNLSLDFSQSSSAVSLGMSDKELRLLFDQLPKSVEGLSSNLGRLYFPDGIELSIGQWQKVSFARTLQFQRAILILDEPSSALDPFSEVALSEAILSLPREKTVLIITHRLNTVVGVDRIIVMQDGRIVESGTHSSLMFDNGVYAAMFRSQASQYHIID